jgi:hypothetical protein
VSAAPSLSDLVAAELAQPVDPRVTAMAAALAAQYPRAARAVLFYGSCLRQRELDGLMLDFYLIVSDYRDAYDSSWLVFANKAVPPNVFPFEHDGLIAKYAVLSEADFARECGIDAGSVSVWARFAQPSRLVWAKDEAVGDAVAATVAQCAPTLFQLTLPMLDPAMGHQTLDVWRLGFSLTYDAELRAERQERSGSIVDIEPARYETFGQAALGVIASQMGVGPNGEVGLIASPRRIRSRWRRLRWKGKALTLLRLAKATTTFAGGVDYIAWKINRHAGTAIEVKPWQRRWPILGALTLLPRLWRGGAIR